MEEPKEPIRILNMFTILNRGGAETMVMNYYRNIDRSKVQFDFLVHREEKGAYEDEIKALGGRIYRMMPIYPQNFHAYKKQIAKFFKKHPEYRIIHSHMSELGYFAFKEAKKQGVPIRICHAHNAPHGWDMKMFMRTYFKKAMMPYITHMFMCGKDSGDWLYGQKNEDKFIQLNNAIDAEEFCYNESNKIIEQEVRKELHLENKLVIGHVGRFYEQKNHERLIDIFEQIYKKNQNTALLLVGTGELEEHIKEKVKQKKLEQAVHFLGSRSDVNRLLQAVDVFLFPSLFEGLPVTMVEAQAAGCLCIISSVIPTECIITKNVLRISLERSDEQWAEKILTTAKKYKKKNTLEAIRKAHFDVKQNAKELENFYIKKYQEE